MLMISYTHTTHSYTYYNAVTWYRCHAHVSLTYCHVNDLTLFWNMILREFHWLVGAVLSWGGFLDLSKIFQEQYSTERKIFF